MKDRHYQQAKREDVRYQITGQGKPLVLLHGLGGSLEDWQFNQPYLSKDYQLIQIDIPGFGQSQATAEQSIPELATVIASVITSQTDQPVSMAGLSLGAVIAMELAVKQNHYGVKVEKIISFNSQPSYKPDRLKEYGEYYFRLGLIKLFGLSALASVIAKRLFIKPKTENMRSYCEKSIKRLNSRTYIKTMKGLMDWDISEQVAELNLPILVVASDRDYASLDSGRYAQLIKTAQYYLVEDCGHAITLEKPELAAGLINEFLRAEP